MQNSKRQIMGQIESWMVSLIISIVGLIAMISVGKYKTETNERAIENERKAREAIGAKLDKANEELIEHKTKIQNSTTMEDVRKEFVSKEMFRQMEKHIDSKFNDVIKQMDLFMSVQEEILKEIRKREV